MKLKCNAAESRHIKDRAIRAMKATVEIKKLNLLSIATALELFNIKVVPIATYSIQLIWNHLILKPQVTRRGKTAYPKRMLCISK